MGFHDTGKTFEAEDPHAYLIKLQERDGCCYSAHPAEQGMGGTVARALSRMADVVRLRA